MIRISRRALLLLAQAVQSGIAAAKADGLEVQVEDPSGAPVEGATVVWCGHHPSSDALEVVQVTRTDAAGKVRLNIAKGSHCTIEIRAVGFHPWTRTIAKSSGDPLKALLVVGWTVLY